MTFYDYESEYLEALWPSDLLRLGDSIGRGSHNFVTNYLELVRDAALSADPWISRTSVIGSVSIVGIKIESQIEIEDKS